MIFSWTMLRFLYVTILLWDASISIAAAFCPYRSLPNTVTTLQHDRRICPQIQSSSRNVILLRSTYDNKSSGSKKEASSGKGGGILDAMLSRHTRSLTKLQDVGRHRVQILTLLRVGLPSVVAGIVSTLVFPGLALSLASLWSDPGVFSVLSQDSSQFVQNFLTVSGLLFSILVGQTYYFLYTQQESIYYALFNEVTEAKSLLEQVALVCQGRSMYSRCLDSISRYVRDDLKQIQSDPAILLSARPVDDPLESIMYMTSVGVPSTVYETVKSLREARAQRLGALQRKLPSIHMLLLWILAAIELVSFPLLGAGTQTIGGYNILTVEGILFGVMTGGIVMTLRVVGELWRPAGGAYNVDSVLSVMVSGLEEELKARMAGRRIQGQASGLSPSGVRDDVTFPGEVASDLSPASDSPRTPKIHIPTTTIITQGGDITPLIKHIFRWIRNRLQGFSAPSFWKRRRP